MTRALTLLLVLAPVVAHADAKSEAQGHIDVATRLFEDGKSAEAIVHLKDAFALDPRPEILYALGQAHAALGQCDNARTFYRRFADASPGDAMLARDASNACKDAPPVVVKPPPVEAPIEPPKPRPTLVHRRWHGDTLGLVIGAAGLVVMGVGAFELSASRSAHGAAAAAATYDEFLDHLDESKSKHALSLGLFAVGGTVVLTGLVHVILHTRTLEPVTPTVTTTGAGVSWMHRF